MNHWVMDYETLSDCFLGVFEHYKTDEVRVFTIGRLRNDLKPFLAFLDENVRNKEWHVSFNGLVFDAQLTHYIMQKRKILSTMTGAAAGAFIYAEAMRIIEKMKAHQFQTFSEKDMIIRQIDLFKLNHWDNRAKSSSLKWIQCSMDWPNVMDMPIPHTESITTVEQLQLIAKYCRNDVKSTKAIMQKCKKEILLRGTLTDMYGINLYSASEPRISKELFLHFLSQSTGISKYELRQLRTWRSQIEVKDIILPYTKFSVPQFQELLRNFEKLVIDPNQTKGGFSYSVNYRGVQTDFGLGGVHGAKQGIYNADEELMIMTSDVVSYYPRLAIVNGWAPAHLPSNDFCKQYKWFFDERKLIPKKDSRNYVYKIILNSTYGLSNDKNSPFYDPEFTMRITINGQLSLMMLYTMLVERIPGSIPLMQNTDGVEIMIPRKYYDEYLKVCKEWEQITSLQLEHDSYQKLVISDVNTYIGVFDYKEVDKLEWLTLQKENPEYLFKREGEKHYVAKTKCKGRFEFKDRPLHKNKSFTVVPRALYYYFVHGLDPKEYIQNCRNIYDFCGQSKSQGNWKFIHYYVKPSSDGTPILHKEALQKTLRYYISNKGGKVIKYNSTDAREINLEAGKWLQTIFNEYQEKPFEEYNINYNYYINELQKELLTLEPAENKQLTLF